MKYRKKQTGFIIFFQLLVCALLLMSCIYIHILKDRATVEAGTFGKSENYGNVTFSDLAETMEKAVFGE